MNFFAGKVKGRNTLLRFQETGTYHKKKKKKRFRETGFSITEVISLAVSGNFDFFLNTSYLC